VRIPAGTHVPFYGAGSPVAVAAFALDRYPVSQAELAEFVAAHPQWRRDRIAPAFAERGYLRSWPSALDPADGSAAAVDVSWFAARAFCASIDARLPTMVEWEYVAAADATRPDASADPAVRAELLELYTRPLPARTPAARGGAPNWFGVHGMHGVVHEWVLDFNSILISDDSRGADNGDRALDCAAAASGARDAADYAAFLRHSYRASLAARATQKNLGFRCARGIS
jgi:formylglycine-generating enzyme required for sulfatase activity